MGRRHHDGDGPGQVLVVGQKDQTEATLAQQLLQRIIMGDQGFADNGSQISSSSLRTNRMARNALLSAW
jgi:hypothetical protein